MKILGIDTSARFLSLGIYNNQKIYEYNLELGVRLSGFITTAIEEAVAAAGLRLKDIDYFACGIGPGSFTGLRVGLATIKGLSFGLDKPVIAVPTLDILARNLRDNEKYIIPVVDAKRALFYCSAYKLTANSYKRVLPYLLLTQDELLKKIMPNSIFLGDGLTQLKEKIPACIRHAQITDKDSWYIKPHNIIEAALDKIKKKEFKNSFNLDAMYLYPKECQIRSRNP